MYEINLLRLQLVDLQSELRLQVGSLVLVDNVTLSQLVQHLLNNRVHLHCFFLIGHCTQLANSITHGLGVISVVQRSRLRLTDSLL